MRIIELTEGRNLEEQLADVMGMMKDAGWIPELCDSPIEVYESTLHAGNPTEMGDVPPDMIMIPRSMVSSLPCIMVKVEGDSMIDLGLEDGQSVMLCIGAQPHENDVVAAIVDGAGTIKCYAEDENGQAWLIPQNEEKMNEYKSIRLDEQVNVHIIGVVVNHLTGQPRGKSRHSKKYIDAAKKDYEDDTITISDERMKAVILMLSKIIVIGRMWYAVYRMLVDYLKVEEDDFDGFCSLVEGVVPHHEHLPKVAEMQAMAVESFAKPVAKWDEKRAPVKGKRFKAYSQLAKRTEELLLMSDEEFNALKNS